MPSESMIRTLRIFGRTVLEWHVEIEADDVELVQLDAGEDDQPRFGFAFPRQDKGDEEDDDLDQDS